MAHCTNTAACAAEGGLVTLEHVRGARASYSGMIVNGPEIPAPDCPAPAPPALLHPNGVSSVRTKKQSATGRAQVFGIIIDSPRGSHCENLRKGNAEPRVGAVVALRFRKKAGMGLETRVPHWMTKLGALAPRTRCALKNVENE
jgi:hypothetical protein